MSLATASQSLAHASAPFRATELGASPFGASLTPGRDDFDLSKPSPAGCRTAMFLSRSMDLRSAATQEMRHER